MANDIFTEEFPAQIMKKKKNTPRFQIRFENEEQRRAYFDLLKKANRVAPSRTLIGGKQLFEPIEK